LCRRLWVLFNALQSDGGIMDKDERLKALHDRATRGSPLTADEEAALAAWYRGHDRLDDRLGGVDSSERLAALDEQLAEALVRLSAAGERVRALAERNDEIRRENDALKRLLEPLLTPPGR
jgi:hypothetical protein